ncbi:MAG: hypothetical protein ABH830_02595 [Patescibacteria group bacterium]
MKKQKKILVIAGPTGVGESTITKKIIKRYPVFTKLTTATTRKPRPGEKHGIDYYFFSKNKFKAEIKNKSIIEYTYIKKTDVYYGSYKPDLEKKLKMNFNIIINLDLAGAKYYKKYYQATTIFIRPESINDLKKRIIVREPNISNQKLKNRLAYASEEINKESRFYDYQVINKQNKLAAAVKQVEKIIKKEGYLLK